MKTKILYFLAAFTLGTSLSFAEEVLTRNISGGVYLNLSQFSRQNQLQYDWDSTVKNVTITGSAGRLKFHVGSEYALHQNEIVDLKSKTRRVDGEIWAPYIAKNFLDPLVQTKAQPVSLSRTLQQIVIDPGHGGEDFGASAAGIREKDLVLQISKKLRDKLRSRGMRVVMTRESDTFISLAERARIANNTPTSFFISIHANASPSKSLKGFEIYTLSEATDDEALATQRAENSVLKYESAQPHKETQDLKAIFWDLKETENRKESLRIVEHLQTSVAQAVETATRRSRTANFYVLKWTESPAALVEIGYITNHEDALRLKSPIYKDRLAEGLAQGIGRYIEEFERTDAYTK